MRSPLASLVLLVGCNGGSAVVPADTDDPHTGDPVASSPPLEICVNELMPANRTVEVGDEGARMDWIELHNPGATPLVLDGWSLTDDRAVPDAAPLDGLEIAAGGWLVLFADTVHLPFTLGDDGEEVGLFAPDGRASIVRYGAMEDDVALARGTDCCDSAPAAGLEGCFDHVWRGTPGGSNGP